jgi:tetratricopeptide (TPR) repeat protein
MNADRPSAAEASRVRRARNHLYAQARGERAGVYYVTGNYDRAIADIKSLLRFYKRKFPPAYPVVASLLVRLAEYIVRGQADYAKAQRIISNVIHNITVHDHPELYARICESRGLIYYYRARYGRALKYYRRALQIYDQLHDKINGCKMTGTIGLLHKIQGNSTLAMKFFKKFLALSEKLGNKNLINSACGFIGSLYRIMGRLSLSLIYLKRNLALSQELGDRSELQTALNNIGNTYLTGGDLNLALYYYQRSLPRAKEKGQQRSLAILYENMGVAYQEKGEVNRALWFIKESISIAQGIGARDILGIACLHKGAICASQNKIKAAEKYLKEAGDIFAVTGNKLDLSELYDTYSDLNFIKKRFSQAVNWAIKSLAIARASKSKDQELMALRSLGKTLFSKVHLAHRGRPVKKYIKGVKQAVSYLERSIALARKQEMRLEMAKSYYELANLYAGVDASRAYVRKAGAYLSEAEKIFNKTGANIWLQKTRSLRSVIRYPGP